MSVSVVLAIVLAVSGSGLLLASLRYTRKGLLTVRYGLGWMAVSVGLVLAGLMAPWLTRLGEFTHLSRAGVVGLGLCLFLVLVAFQLSVSVSGLQDIVRDLAESHALLAARLREFDGSAATESSDSFPAAASEQMVDPNSPPTGFG